MKPSRKAQDETSELNNPVLLGDFNNFICRKAFRNLRPAQGYLFEEPICNQILNGLLASEMENLFSSLDLVYLGNHEYLYQPDDFVKYLYFPETAVISEFQILEDGKTVEVAMTGREGIIGITSILNSHSSSNWFQVLIPGKALRMDSEFCRQKLNGCKVFRELIFDFVNLYISQISQRVICNNHHSVEERLCFWLSMVSDRCGNDRLPLTQEQIARFLGVHRPSVTLITQSLRADGVIDYLRGKISILNKKKLESLSCPCYETIAGIINTV